MARAVLIVLLVAAVFAATVMSSPPVKKCGKNEIWNSCGTACEPSCKNPKPEICTKQCVIGCQCANGFLRNKNNRCVKPCDC
ncbi:hypothetical protein KM043_006415 [Ampulex compressa]|nr:hypothetical protein KM043_006415 [Ampulex compressa]